MKLEDYRYERKYVTHSYQYGLMLSFLYKSGFESQHEDRSITSTYFDTHGLNYYLDNLSGISQRKKVRVRTYNLFSPPTLELKLKNGFLGRKISFPLSSYRDITDMEHLSKEYGSDNFRFFLLDKTKQFLRPTVTVAYMRKYFVGPYDWLRATIDTDQVYTLLNPITGAPQNSIVVDREIILEFKYPYVRDAEFRNFINGYSERAKSIIDFRFQKSSKYTKAMDAFNGSYYM